jgi:hypothetical protein
MSSDTSGTKAVGFSDEEVAAHREHDHLAAVFADREHATAAVDELRELHLGSEHLGVAVRADEAVVFEHDEDAELLRDAEVGAASGISIGALAGLGLAALAVPGIGTIGAGGIFALAGASALWGGLLGAYFGAAAGETGWAAHADLGYTALAEDEVLVVVCSHGHPAVIRDVMERHEGRWHLVPAGRL